MLPLSVLPLSVLPVTVLNSSSATSTSEPIVTATPLEAAQAACNSGSALCGVVTDTTGSATAGKWAEVLVGLPLHILLIVTVAIVVRWVLHRLINKVVEGIAGSSPVPSTSPARAGRPSRMNWLGDRAASVMEMSPLAVRRRAQRARTLGSVLRSIASGVIVIVTTLMILSELGLDITPLLASAGIVGIAVGFGAQSLVKDFLSGMFMILEDQYGVGDTVNLGDAVGTVEYVGLRVTQVRDLSGTLWYVPNGGIARVGNQSQGWGRAVVDITVAHGQDVAKATNLMLEAGHQLRADPDWADLILDEPEVWGVEQMTAGGVTLRAVVKTQATKQFVVSRELRRRIGDAFDTAGISFPFAQAGVAGPGGVLEPPAKP